MEIEIKQKPRIALIGHMGHIAKTHGSHIKEQWAIVKVSQLLPSPI